MTGDIYEATTTDTQDYKTIKKGWEKFLRQEVGKKCFGLVQFVSDDDDQYGSEWQKLVYETMPNQPQNETVGKDLWMMFARDQARVAINRRRQNMASQMKRRFEGELCVGVCVCVCDVCVGGRWHDHTGAAWDLNACI